MYFQCDPKENVANWDDDRIWAEFRSRVNGNGFELKEGPVLEKMVLPFRSFVAVALPAAYGRSFRPECSGAGFRPTTHLGWHAAAGPG